MARPNRILEIVNFLNTDQNLVGLFQLNMMTNDIEFTRASTWGGIGRMTDNDVILLKYYLSYCHAMEYNVSAIEEAVLVVASRKTYNPLIDYLKNLVWDGKSRLDSWLIDICQAEDNQYVRDVGRKILCAAVRRALEPGCKFDHMVILEGGQGVGKSTLVDFLGGQWYLDTHLSGSENKKDIVDSIRDAWIIEISDLAGFRKSDVEYLKHFLTDRSDRVRLPYARRSVDFPRQCIFIGTHNPSGNNEYFKDDTGNRRFWPIECGIVDLNRAKDERDQLFAEAFTVYKNEILFITDPVSIEIMNNLHKSRQVEIPLTAMIDTYILNLDYVTNKEIIEQVFKMNVGHLSVMELRSKCTIIGIHMRRLGWRKGDNEKRGWYFRPGYLFNGPVPEQAQPKAEVAWDD